ncbi:hypothetical protein PVAND_000107 [Polypedilum vanderplanki]|uniref:Uncharacterized protein n=1 Tax=Polypedilum vanderplanki TaxID=319348 RepID=A0A9J6BKA6_POLVA|nr:hypothetical protein PVAND_000107 [Polypedilum vanderplanki]
MTQVIPLTYYSKNDWIPFAPLITSTIVPHTMRTMDISPYITGMNSFEMFHRDQPSKAMSELYKYFYDYKPYTIMYGNDKKKDSWWDYFNPFSCDTDYEDDEDAELTEIDDDYSDSSSELFKRRKMKKTLKHKKKKSKKKLKKKKILIKFIIGFLAFLAIKFLLEKLWYIFPTIFPTTARDELLNEVDLLLEEGIELDRKGNEWRKAKIFEVENRALFAPEYDETRIDFNYPLKQRIFTYFFK